MPAKPKTAPRVLPLRKWLALVLLGAVWALAVALTVKRDAVPLPALDEASGKLVAGAIAAREPSLRTRARVQFPYDHWSQDDAFHAQEQQAVRAAAARERADLGSVLDALDSYLRSHPSPLHKPGASPCKPRPYYD